DEDEDPKEDEFKKEEDPLEEEYDMEVDIEEDENEPELTFPYEEVDPLNPLPPASESEPKDVTEAGNPVEHEDETVPASVHEVDKAECKKLKKELEEERIMPSKSAPLTQAIIRRMIKENVDAAITAERARQANVRNDDRGSRPVWVKMPHLLWFKKTVSVFGISECAEGKKVKFAAATLRGHALTWWNAKVAAMGLETVNQMPWAEMKQFMTAEFCPIEEIQRMEHELWNLKVKEYNIVAYTQRFNELALMCPRMVELKRVKVDAYIEGLTDNIKGEVTYSRPANLNEAVPRDERTVEAKKRKWENIQSGNSSATSNHRDNSHQTLQNNQKQGKARAMVTTPTNGKEPSG
nr:hypothetical protein [Tanacetum cinerariifolium]